MYANQITAQFLETLDSLDKQGKHVPGLIISRPGFGKTSTIEMWSKLKDYNLLTLIASNFSADDILGIQAVQDGELKRLTPSWYNNLIELAKNGKRNILFLDEITATDSFIQAPLFNLIFNHDLAGKKLPENTLIISAGNYSEDLNNAFKMTAPLVNRFMILNLTNDDFCLAEILDNNINDITEKKDIEKFLGLDIPNKKKYSYPKFINWIKENKREFTLGEACFTEDSSLGGLLGFTSLRSFNYSLQFAEAYMNTYNDSIWMRIVGDTLGISNKRENKPLRDVLKCNESSFILSPVNASGKAYTTISDICEDIEAAGELTDSLADKLKTLIMATTMSTITTEDLTKFTALSSKYSTDSRLKELSSMLAKQLEM